MLNNKPTLLAIDIGNTTIACGISNDGATWEETRVATNRNYEVSELGDALARITKSPDQIAISSVVPQLDQVIKQSCLNRFKVKPTFYTNLNIPLKNIIYSPPEGVGADRLINAFAAYTCYSLPAIIVDLGTATTFCVVDKGPIYLGGAIAAGISISAEALFLHAARLKEVPLEYPSSTIGKNLGESISSGILIGHCAMIEGMIIRFSKEFHQKPTTILTGGWSKTLGEKMKNTVDIIDEYLTFKGLWSLVQSK